MGEATGSAGRGRPSKVARLIEAEGLEGLGAELERKWTAEGPDRHSLRDLATLFNRRLLEARLRAAGLHSLSGEVANLYRLLTDDDVSAADRTRARRRLERDGVDVAALQEDFVSYQSVRTYLQNHRDVAYDPQSAPLESAESTIGRLRSRLASVTESKLTGASDADALDVGEFDVTVSVRVACRDCGQQMDVATLLEDGGCGCP
jgi:hypothetical protein